jgi:hypothetical protein
MLGRVLAGSLALFCFTAYAQSVQIYGIADTSIEVLDIAAGIHHKFKRRLAARSKEKSPCHP